MEAPNPQLAPEFDREAAPPPEQVTVSLKLDTDLLEWLKGQPRDWQTEINTTMRFFMETSNTPPVPPPHADAEADYIPDFNP
jgi:uncharacterized protein (DUF4415 family)